MSHASRLNINAISRHFYVWTRRLAIFGANGALWEIIRQTMPPYPVGASGPQIPWMVVVNAATGFFIWYLLRNVEEKYPDRASSA